MTQNAIGASPGIFLQGAQNYQNANSKIFDAITSAADMYDKMQAQKQANLTALRQKQLEIEAQKQATMLDPEKVSMMVLAKAQQDPNSVTPQERASFDAAQKVLGAKVAIQPQTGQAYNPYQPIPLAGGQTPTAEMFAPQGNAMAPQAAKPASTYDGIMSLAGPNGEAAVPMQVDKLAPPPVIGYKPEKITADSPMANTPVGQMKEYDTNLKANSDIATMRAAKEADFNMRKDEIKTAKSDFQSALDDLYDINKRMNDAGLLKSSKGGSLNNAKNIGANLPLGIGSTAETIADPAAAALREEFRTVRASALQAYKKAAGVTGGEMNTPAEYENVMKAMGSEGGFYESNLAGLKSVSKRYGTGDFGSKKETKGDAAPAYTEGQTAVNPKTGEKAVYKGGKWQKM